MAANLMERHSTCLKILRMKGFQLPLPLFQSEWIAPHIEKSVKAGRRVRQKLKDARKKRAG